MNSASIDSKNADGLRAVCALYMRVSTKGHGQTTDTQALALPNTPSAEALKLSVSIETKESAAVKTHGRR